jgi:integration host factor subunit beta
VEVPSKRIPYFKPSKELRDLVNQTATAPAETPAGPAPAVNHTEPGPLE